jgi:hypothetical protein
MFTVRLSFHRAEDLYCDLPGHGNTLQSSRWVPGFWKNMTTCSLRAEVPLNPDDGGSLKLRSLKELWLLNIRQVKMT